MISPPAQVSHREQPRATPAGVYREVGGRHRPQDLTRTWTELFFHLSGMTASGHLTIPFLCPLRWPLICTHPGWADALQPWGHACLCWDSKYREHSSFPLSLSLNLSQISLCSGWLYRKDASILVKLKWRGIQSPKDSFQPNTSH